MSSNATSSSNEAPAVARDRRYRMIGTASFVAIVALGSLLALVTTGADASLFETEDLVGFDSSSAHYSGVGPSRLVLSHLKVRDTVYTTDSVYLEVNLKKQDVTVHHRDGRERTFLVSTGNPYIREGMATPAGVFTVQNMTPMAISKQFNNARLHHWIGVQGGV